MEINALLPEYEAVLDPDYVQAYKANVVGRTLEHQTSIEEVRRDPAAYRVSFGVPAKSGFEDQCEEVDFEVQVEADTAIAVRTYRSKSTDANRRPAHLNFHGGGWTVGGIGVDAHWCQRLAVEANAVVFDIGYRHAPEHKFPIAIEDSWKALMHITENAASFGIDTDRLSLGGISAGANIAAVMTNRCIRETSLRPVYLCLCVPVTDASAISTDFEIAADCPYESWTENRDAPFLSYHRMSWFYRLYLPAQLTSELLKSPSLSPLYSVKSGDFPAGLHPPTLVCVAAVDVLWSEGKAYAEALARAGVEVRFKKFDGVPHNFSRQTDLLAQAREYADLSISSLTKALSKGLR